jgi:hypothetical protein
MDYAFAAAMTSGAATPTATDVEQKECRCTSSVRQIKKTNKIELSGRCTKLIGTETRGRLLSGKANQSSGRKAVFSYKRKNFCVEILLI